MERVAVVDQHFINRCSDPTIGLLVSTVVDYFLVAGHSDEIQLFFKHLDKLFTLGSTDTCNNLLFLSFSISINPDCSVTLYIGAYIIRIRPITVSR